MSPNTLDQVRIATPCNASWEEMEGTDSVRFCSQCSLNVYNISKMNRDEAGALFSKTEGRVCVRLFRRDDGTIITRDCPVAKRALHRQVLALGAAILGAMFLMGTAALASAGLLAGRSWAPPTQWSIFSWINPPPPYGPEMGDICIEEPPAWPPTQQVPPAEEETVDVPDAM